MTRRLPLACLGLTGSILITLAGPRLAGGGAIRWWFDLRIAPGHTGNVIALYLGMALLGAAWLALGRALPTVRELWAIGALWCLPLFVGQALYSHDIYSYLAQGTIVHLGLNPYHAAPSVLGRLGHGHVLAAVSPFWRRTTAPYGPLFLSLVSLIVAVTGAHLIVGVLAIRALELAGIALVALFVPRLARVLGGDPARATWLAALSPLVLLELVAAGHNDALMIGLLVAGVTLAAERRPLTGIALCALAATIKVPAIAGVALIAMAWARSAPGSREALRRVGVASASALAVLGAVTVVTGLGLDWISSSIFSTPAKVRLSITPATAVGYTVAHLLGDVGATVSSRGLESTLGVVGFGIVGLLGARLLWHASARNLVPYAGLLLAAIAVGGPAAWPWYLTWGIALLASWPAAQRWRMLPPALVGCVFLVKANGILVLPLSAAPVVLVVYLLIGAGAGYAWARRSRATARLLGAAATTTLPEPRGLG